MSNILQNLLSTEDLAPDDTYFPCVPAFADVARSFAAWLYSEIDVIHPVLTRMLDEKGRPSNNPSVLFPTIFFI